MLIKFCGMTREEDLAVAVELGVGAVGFILWPGSPRFVPPERLGPLVKGLPASVIPVGVFVRPSLDEISAALEAGVRVVQLHGVDAPINGLPCEIWIAAVLAQDGIEPKVENVTVLLDAEDRQRHGGTGRTIDWAAAARIAASRRVILAGGLRPANVADAVRAVRPYGVDVASGIEAAPGAKNPQAMRAFVAAVREVNP